MNLRWFSIAAFAACMLFLGNVARIVALVMLDLVLDRRELAQLFHETLGLLSFTFVLLLSWQLMRLFVQRNAINTSQTNDRCSKGISKSTVSMTTLLLSALLLGVSLLAPVPVEAERAVASRQWELAFSAQHYTQEALQPIERQFFVNNNAMAYKFSSSIELTGKQHQASVLVVFADHWKAQHLPEHCYMAQGYRVNSSSLQAFVRGNKIDDMHVRQLGLQKIDQSTGVKRKFTAAYWFQSADKTTVNFSRRVLDQIFNRDVPWSMVSVLWDEAAPVEARQQLLSEIQEMLSREMKRHG